MIRLLIVLAVIIMILSILRNRSKFGSIMSSKMYRNLIIIVIVVGSLFFLATSGKFIIPQFLNIIKLALPFLTKLIGI